MFPGSTLSDHCLRYENIPQIKMIVVLGELGGQDEYSLVRTPAQGHPQLVMCALMPFASQAAIQVYVNIQSISKEGNGRPNMVVRLLTFLGHGVAGGRAA